MFGGEVVRARAMVRVALVLLGLTTALASSQQAPITTHADAWWRTWVAQRQTAHATARLQRMTHEIVEIDLRIDAALTLRGHWCGQAKARLEKLRQKKLEMERRLAEAKAVASRAKRLKVKVMKVSAECQNNPLAKGCM